MIISFFLAVGQVGHEGRGMDFFDRPPSCYLPASFQYNARCVLGLLPGAIMLAVVAGRT